MPRKILDTNVLINFWGLRSNAKATGKCTVAQARAWGDALIKLEDTNAILTPIYIEFVAGTRSVQEIQLARAYLGRFKIVDEGRVLAQDWIEAQRIAERVPYDGLHRRLGDCLIRAICNRLNYTVVTREQRFPW